MFGRDIYEGEISLEKADEDQSNLMNEIRIFNAKTCVIFLMQEKKFLMDLRAKYF